MEPAETLSLEIQENVTPVEPQAPVAVPMLSREQVDADFDQVLADFKAGKVTLSDGTEPAPVVSVTETEPVVEAAPEAVEEPAPVEEKPEPSDGKQFRLRAKDPRDIAVFAVMKATPGLSYTEAAETIFGKQAPATPATAEETSLQAVDTVESLDAEMKRLRAERKTAMTEMDLEKVGELDDQLFDLPMRRAEAASRQAQAAVQADTASVAEWTASQNKAVELYPDAAVETSALYKRTEEIIEVMQENSDPLLGKPDSILKVIQMAAAELGLPPRRVAAATPVKQPIKPPAPEPVRMRPTAGSGQGAAAPPVPVLAAQAIDNMTLEELSAYNRNFGKASR